VHRWHRYSCELRVQRWSWSSNRPLLLIKLVGHEAVFSRLRWFVALHPVASALEIAPPTGIDSDLGEIVTVEAVVDGLAPSPGFMRRRLVSVIPPQISKRSSCSRAWSRHSWRTGQPRQTMLARREERPFSGKKRSGSLWRHLALMTHGPGCLAVLQHAPCVERHRRGDGNVGISADSAGV
jgi:hypothetical protein